jgi:ectoine hydroxylase-related dioxygenase (phytanoyl-CoA dioxygenase family)
MDRFSKPRKDTSTMAESWHRDITNSENVRDDDIICDGWVNLDPPKSDPQGFSCVPGTHRDFTNATGFVKFTNKEIEEYKKQKKRFLKYLQDI